MKKSLIDYIIPEDWDRYNELLTLAGEAKAAAPKKVAKRGPMTAEQKVKAAQNRLAAAQAKLDALLAAASDAE